MKLRRLLLVAGVAACVGLGWFTYSWFRDSSLVKVRQVQVTGATNEQAPKIRRALKEAALDMTTLHVDEGALEASVESYPVVRSVSASADFPNKLKIDVHEYRPSAVVADTNGRRVAVASDGTLLPKVDRKELPSVKVAGVSTDGKITDRRSLELIDVLAAVPAKLRARVERAYWGPRGVRVKLRDGPTVRFGQPEGGVAKWRAAARVLADPSSDGAETIDVRVPSRPVAGGFGAGAPGTAGTLPPSEQQDQQSPGAVPAPQAAPVQDSQPPANPQL